MAKRELPSPETLRQLLRYEPETGKLFWKSRSAEHFPAKSILTSAHLTRIWNAKKAGKEAFTSRNSSGYSVGSIFDVQYSAHRVAWCIHYGAWPDAVLDHVNGDPSDNRIANLRQATKVENARNSRALSHSSSRFRGVSYEKSRAKWLSSIMIEEGGKKRRVFLGRHETEECAARAYDAAAAMHFGEFARLNLR